MNEACARGVGPWTTKRFLGLAVAVWALLSVLSLLRHYTFHSSVYDVGIFDQVLWNTAHGRPFASSLSHMSYLGDHFSPSLALLAPIEWLPRSLDLLFLAQAAMVAVTAWNVFELARRHLDPRTAWLIGVATLLSPALYCPILADIHPEPFMAAALSRALLDLDRGAHARAAVWLLVVIGGKEDAGILLASLGVLLAFEPRMRRFGIGLAVLSLAWTVTAMTVVMPAIRPPMPAGTPWHYLDRLSHLGASPKEVVLTVLLHPLHTLYLCTTLPKLVMIVMLLGPFSFAPLHYLVPAVPVIAWAAIAGAPYTMVRRPRLAALFVVGFGISAVAWRFDPEPLTPRPNQAALRAAIASVPPDAPVCVENWFGAHLSARESVDFCVEWKMAHSRYRYFGWPTVSDARYQVFDLADTSNEHPGLLAREKALEAAGAKVVFDRDRVIVLRVGGHAGRLDSLEP
jgi:hypothetical protein